MLQKGLALLVVCLAIATGLAMNMPWRTQGTMRPGETRTINSSNDAVIKTGADNEYYEWGGTLAPAVEASAFVTGSNGLEIVSSKTTAVAKTVTWTQSKTTYTAPGAEVNISATVKAPAHGTGTLMKAEWWAEVFARFPEYGNNLDFKHLAGVIRNGRLLLATFIMADAPNYQAYCWQKSFLDSLPIALSLFVFASLFLFGKKAEPAQTVGSAGWSKSFPASYSSVKTWYALLWFCSVIVLFIFSSASLFSNEGDNLEQHPIAAMATAGVFLLALGVAALTRHYYTHRVEVRSEALAIDCGEGWGPTITLPWHEIASVERKVITNKGRVTGYFMRIHRREGKKITLRSTGTRGYHELLDAIGNSLTSLHGAQHAQTLLQ